ncbi:MAG: hypothetical protein J6U14_10400 [Bacteroidaceae bacterium]|nr:hypothetical protein [Bacteroidaceae bacterium]
MNIKSLLSTAVLALIATACTNDVNDVMAPEAVQQQGGIHFTATIAPKTFDANTRMLTEKTGEDNNAYLEASWAKDETFVLVYEVDETEQTTVATVTDVANDGTATIEAEIVEGVADNTSVTLHYPGDTYSDDIITSQDGKLSNKMDVRTGTGTIEVTGGVATLADGATLSAEYAIVKFSLADLEDNALEVNKLVITTNEGDTITTIVPEEANNTLYAALPVNDIETYWFEATDSDSKPYVQKGSPQVEKGKFYTPTLKMATLGDLMGADGKFYVNGEAAVAAETTPIGVIAHLGNDPTTEDLANGGGHGLLMALKNAGGNLVWTTVARAFALDETLAVKNTAALKRTTNVSGYTSTMTLYEKENSDTVYPAAYKAKNYSPAAPESTTGWFLPSAQQWVKMLTGLGGLDVNIITLTDRLGYFDNESTAATKLDNALKKAGDGNYDSVKEIWYWYWTSSEYDKTSTVNVVIDAEDPTHGIRIGYRAKNTTLTSNKVRAILAF